MVETGKVETLLAVREPFSSTWFFFTVIPHILDNSLFPDREIVAKLPNVNIKYLISRTELSIHSSFLIHLAKNVPLKARIEHFFG